MCTRFVVSVLLLCLVFPGTPVAQERSETSADPGKQEEDSGKPDRQDDDPDEPGIMFEEVVVTGTRTRRVVLDTPLPTHVVHHVDIEEKNPVNVGEIVSDTPGVSMVSPAGVYFTNPSIRGLSGRRVVMLVDGLRVDTGKTMGATGFFMDPHGLGRVEIVRGPGSVVYGSDAIGGVVNLISSDPFAREGLHAGYGYLYGSNNEEMAHRARATYGGDRFALQMSGMKQDADNYSSGTGEVDMSQYHATALNLGLGAKVSRNDTTHLRFLGYWGEDTGKASSDLDLEKHMQIYFPEEDHYRLWLTHVHDFPSATGFWDEIRLEAMGDWTDRNQFVDVYDATWSELSTRTRKTGDFFLGGGSLMAVTRPGTKHRLSLGLDFYGQRMNSTDETDLMLGNEWMTIGEETGFADANRYDLGVFAQEEWEMSSALSGIAGLRYDLIVADAGDTSGGEEVESPESRVTDHAVTGNVGLVWRVTRRLSLTANFGGAFRAPTLQEKFLTYQSCWGQYNANPELKPETSYNFDLGMKGNFGIVQAEAYGFYIYAMDLISIEALDAEAGEYRWENVGQADLAGGEARIAVPFRLFGPAWPRFSPFVSGAYVWAQDRNTGKSLPQIPPLRINAGVKAEKRSARHTWYVQVLGGVSIAQERVAEDEDTTGAYATLDASAGLKLHSRTESNEITLRVAGRNLTDAAYRDHLSSVEGMGRTIRVGVDVTF